MTEPRSPLTLADYAALPEDEGDRFELQEGMLLMSPRPQLDHQDALAEICFQLHSQLPAGLRMVIKRGEYADAGIGHYWMVDLDGGASLTACHLGGASGYIEDEPATGTFVTDVPFSARLDLGALV